METSLTSIYRSLKLSYYGSRKEELDSRIFWHRYFFRPLSFAPTAVFLRAKLSANCVSIGRFPLLWIACALLLSSDNTTRLAAAGLYLAYYILDFVDGNIARFLRSSSFFGKLIDGFIDGFNRIIFLPLAIGTSEGELRWATQTQLTVCAALLVFTVLMTDQFRFRVLALRLELEANAGSPAQTPQVPASGSAQTSRKLFQTGKRIIDEIHEAIPVVVTLAIIVGAVEEVVMFYTITHVFASLAEIVVTLISSRKRFSATRSI